MTTYPLEESLQQIRTAVHKAITVAEQTPPRQMLTVETPQIVDVLNECLAQVKASRSMVVRHMHQDGWTYRQIAQGVGLSPQRVGQMVTGKKADA